MGTMRTTFHMVCENHVKNVKVLSQNSLQPKFRCLHNNSRSYFVVCSTTARPARSNGSFYQLGSRPQVELISARYIHGSSSHNKRDYYDVLGISKSASTQEIKKAYYKLAKKYHPDVSKNDKDSSQKFQEVSEAYEVLSDAGKKQQYDSFGMSGQGFAGSGPFQQGGQYNQGFEQFHGTVDPEELFRTIFGAAGFRSSGFSEFSDFAESSFGFAPASEVKMNLTFQQAARGCNREIDLNVTDTCPRCAGNKAEPGTSKVRCHHCNGTGMETISTGPFVMRSTCRRCYGTRVLIKTPCVECEGKGKTVQRRKVIVPVPAGVEDGQTVRMPVGNKEIFITFKVEKSKHFRREGADIHSDVTVSLAQAVLGGTIRTPGIYEDILLNIPSGTNSHTKIRMAGKGVSRAHSYGFGDHYIHVKIRVPSSLSSPQKSLLLAYAETESNVDGTVKGLADTAQGKLTTEDEDGRVAEIRKVLNEMSEDENDKRTQNS